MAEVFSRWRVTQRHRIAGCGALNNLTDNSNQYANELKSFRTNLALPAKSVGDVRVLRPGLCTLGEEMRFPARAASPARGWKTPNRNSAEF